MSVARLFLLATGIFFLAVYALPLTLAPLRWARWFRWPLPTDTPTDAMEMRLASYFGRCVGVLAIVVLGQIVYGAVSAAAQPTALALVAAIGGLMTALHTYGALRRVQPWTEDAEVVLYLGATVLALWLRGMPA